MGYMQYVFLIGIHTFEQLQAIQTVKKQDFVRLLRKAAGKTNFFKCLLWSSQTLFR